jgi:cytidylate kinase
MSAGTFLTVSGMDGAGKSTLIRALRDSAADSARWPAVVVVAPLRGDPDLVRGVTRLAAPREAEWPERESWLAGYFSLRIAIEAERIAQARAAGALVVADRWWPDHVVNQSHFGTDLAEWRDLLDVLPVPDLSVWVDVPFDVARARVAARGGGGLGSREDFLRSAAAAFPRVMVTWPHHRVDGECPPAASAQEILGLLRPPARTAAVPAGSARADVVTLDGPSGVGKTAVARSLAGALGWRWVSAGLLYRALAAAGGEQDEVAVDFRTAADGIADPVVTVGRHCYAEPDLRRPDLGTRASRLAQDPAVRRAVADELRRLRGGGLVLEGRSMHHVAPDAALSVYLWADRAERAARAEAAGLVADESRDAADRSRGVEPLRLIAGMTAWNSTRYTLDQTVAGLVRRVRIGLGDPVRVAVLATGETPVRQLANGRFGRHTVEIIPPGHRIDDADIVLRLPPGGVATPDWLAAHLRALLAGNDVVTVGPPVGAPAAWAGVNRNLTGDAIRLGLAAGGNVGHTADIRTLGGPEPAGSAPPPQLPAGAAGARWVLVLAAIVPAAIVPAAVPADLAHVRTDADRDRLLDELQERDERADLVVIDHTGDPTLPLLVEAAAPRRGVRVLGPEGRE